MEVHHIRFGSFAFPPVFLSVMSFVFYNFGRYKNKTCLNKVAAMVMLSFLICFVYPVVTVYTTNRDDLFENFYWYCFISSLVTVAINYIFLFFMRLKNEKN